LRKQQQDRDNWARNGHGNLTFCTDEKEFFRFSQASRRVVVHFCRTGNKFCDLLNQHLRRLAELHMETRFLVVEADRAPFLVERLHIRVMPTIVLCREGKTEKSLPGLDWVDPTGSFETWVLERRLFDEDYLESKPLEAAARKQIEDDVDWSDLDE
jgi:thioredoxin-like negative regulator of GroEL